MKLRWRESIKNPDHLFRCRGSLLYGENYTVFSSNFTFFDRSTNNGVAMNNDEYVPTITPTIKAKMNPLIAAPPNMKMINNTMKVVIDVLIVRDNVEFNDLLMFSVSFVPL